MEKLHLHTIQVQEASQAISFRIYLPKDLKAITGVQFTENTRISTIDPNSDEKSQVLLSNLPIGRLHLKQRGVTGRFFSADVIRNDNSLRYGDFDNLDFYQTPELTLTDFYLHDWVLAGAKWDYFPVETRPCSNILLGFYKDRFIEDMGIKTEYSITIYLKYESR